MSHTNAWADPSDSGAADVIEMAAFLEAHSANPVSLAVIQKLWCAAQGAQVADAISIIERVAWVTELKTRLQAGTFFASAVYFINVEGWMASKT